MDLFIYFLEKIDQVLVTKDRSSEKKNSNDQGVFNSDSVLGFIW